MVNVVEEDAASQPSQNGSATLQQPRTDLQPTDQNAQQSSSASQFQQTPVVSQDQLRSEELKVGSSTIQNTTSTSRPPVMTKVDHNYLNAAWLWLIVPIVLACVLFWPSKKAPEALLQAQPGSKKQPKSPVQSELKSKKTVKAKKKRAKR